MPLIPEDKLLEQVALGRYPHYYSCPVFTHDPLLQTIRNGTLTIIDTGSRIFGITCAHVIDHYLQNIHLNPRLAFYVGTNHIDPLSHIIDYDKELDLVSLRLDLSMLSRTTGMSVPEIGSRRVQNIYRDEIKQGDRVTLGGLPGKWQRRHTLGYPVFETFTVVCGDVASASVLQFSVILNDPESWPVQRVSANDMRESKSLIDLGGISGGPAFIESGSPDMQALAGIIYEGSFIMGGDVLVLFLRPAKLINPDGTFERDYVYFSAHPNPQTQSDMQNTSSAT